MKNHKYPQIDNYTLSLDVGTNSVGYTVLNQDLNVENINGFNMIGVNVFPSGENKAARRMFRSHRRLARRRHSRIKALYQYVFKDICERNHVTLTSLYHSGLTRAERREKGLTYQDPIRKYGFHTISEAKVAAMGTKDTPAQKMPVDVLYIIISNILLHRGNFLVSTPIEHFKPTNFKVDDALKVFNDNLALITGQSDLIHVENAQQIKDTAINKANNDKLTTNQQRQKAMAKLISDNKPLGTAISKALMNYKFQLNDIFLNPISTKKEDERKHWQLDFTKATIDEDVNAIKAELTNEQSQVLNKLIEFNNFIQLIQLVPEGMTLSQARNAAAQQHRIDLKQFKQFIKDVKAANDDVNNPAKTKFDKNEDERKTTAQANGKDFKRKTFIPTDYAKPLKDYYEASIHRQKHLVITGQDKKAHLQYCSHDDFIKQVTAYMKLTGHANTPAAQYIEQRAKTNQLLKRQRGSENMNIPMQLNGQDLRAIIKAQAKFYPELKRTAPHHPNENLIDYLFRFKLDYWMGPLTTPESQTARHQNVHSWLKLKPGVTSNIDIFNYQNKVDMQATANQFIQELIGSDANYLGTPVLPNNNLDIQRYKVLSELNSVWVNGHKLKPNIKQAVYHDLFENGQGNVTTKQFKTYLAHHYNLPNARINGLSNDKKFSNSLSTYHTLKRILPHQIDDEKYHDDINTITNWMTIFPTPKMLKHQLDRIDWLTEDQRNRLKNISYVGWSKISSTILNDIKDENGHSLLDLMWQSTIALSSWLAQPWIKQQVDDHNFAYLNDHPNDFWQNFSQLPGEVKRSIHRAANIAQEVVTTHHNQAPKYLVVESTRATSNNQTVPVSRAKKLLNLYDNIQGHDDLKVLLNAVIDTAKEQSRGISNRQYLYFQQLGKDMYSGQTLDYSKLSWYQMDHIIPQSIVKDDSLDNLVLIDANENHAKGNQTAYQYCMNNQLKQASITEWKQLNRLKLLTTKKYKYLMLDSNIDKYTKTGFINRQFTDTSMVVKWLNLLFHNRFPNTKLVKVNGVMNKQVSDYYGWIKDRDLNDTHHGFDAYRNAIIANYYEERFNNLSGFFEYGKHQYGIDIKSLKHLNFLSGLNPNQTATHTPTTNPIDVKYRQILHEADSTWYNSEKISVTRATFFNHGSFYAQNMMSAKDARVSKGLVIEKAHHPVAQYGGYGRSVGSHTAIIKVVSTAKHPKPTEFITMVVPMITAMKFKTMDNNAIDDQLLAMFTQLNPKLIKDTHLSVWKRRVGLNQLVKFNPDGSDKHLHDQYAYMSTAKRLQPAHQLHLATDDIKLLHQTIPSDATAYQQYSTQLDGLFDRLLENLATNYQIFGVNNQKLVKNKAKFESKLIQDTKTLKANAKPSKSTGKYNNTDYNYHDGKLTILRKILQACHNNGHMTTIKDLNVNSLFGCAVKQALIFHVGDRLINKSITGLYGNTEVMR